MWMRPDVFTQRLLPKSGQRSAWSRQDLADVALVEGGHTVYVVVGDLFGYVSANHNFFGWFCLGSVSTSAMLE